MLEYFTLVLLFLPVGNEKSDVNELFDIAVMLQFGVVTNYAE